MPDVDVTPAGCIRMRPAERLSKHRPFLMVGASLPQNPVHPPAAKHVHTREFPELEHLPYVGIGSIKGSNEAPASHYLSEPAFHKPVDGQAAPRPKEWTSRPVTTTLTTPTTSAATYASAASPLNGHQHQQALVKVDRMSDAQVQAAQKATPPKEAGSASTPSASTSKQDPSKAEAMDTDADQSTQKVATDKKGEEVTTHWRSSRSASASQAQKDTSSSRTGKTASTSQGSKG